MFQTDERFVTRPVMWRAIPKKLLVLRFVEGVDMSQLSVRLPGFLGRRKAEPAPFVPSELLTKREKPNPVQGKITGLTRKDRVALAFKEKPLDQREAEALKALLDHPGSTAVELSQICGWMDTAWRTQMLLMCHQRRHFFWPEGLSDEDTNGIVITAIAEYDAYALTFCPRKEFLRILRRAVKAAG